MKNKNQILIRIVLVIFIPLFITMYLVNEILTIDIKHNPLIPTQDEVATTNNKISIQTKPLEKLSQHIGINLQIFEYEVIAVNKLIDIIEGAGVNYAHKVQITINSTDNSFNETELPFGEKIELFADQKLDRVQTLLRLASMNYKANINLKPELLLNTPDNSVIKLHKEIQGNIEIISKPNLFSRTVLLISVFILFGLTMQILETIIKFIYWKY